MSRVRERDELSAAQLARRARMIQAARTLLEAGDFDRIQMRDVAETSGLALGTVYRYFHSKEHLFSEVLVEWVDSLQSAVQRRPLRGGTEAERLVDLLSRVLTAFERYPQFFRLTMYLENTPDPHAAEGYRRFRERSAGVYAGSLVAVDPETARVVSDVARAVVGMSLRTWSSGGITMHEARESVAACINLLFTGVNRTDLLA